MNYPYNPYNPTFGNPPRAYIHRYQEEGRITNEFCQPECIPMSYMIIGARGVGKTVLMHQMANQFEEYPDWVVARMNPNTDMIDSLLQKLSGSHKLTSLIQSFGINLSFFGLGVSMKTAPIREREDAIVEILKGMQKREKRLLIIVDEATNTDFMKTFASAYQNFIGQNLPVYLLMTGLYENIHALKNEKNLTFLYRMPKILLQPLKISEITENYKEVFHIDEKKSKRMAELTKGYSFAFQVLGKLTWENGGDFEKVLNPYQNELFEMVYEKIWEEMSSNDKDVVYAIAKSDTGKIKDIRDFLNWPSNKISPYRDRLMKKGIVTSNRYGYLTIILPFFKKYILDNYEVPFTEEELPHDL